MRRRPGWTNVGGGCGWWREGRGEKMWLRVTCGSQPSAMRSTESGPKAAAAEARGKASAVAGEGASAHCCHLLNQAYGAAGPCQWRCSRPAVSAAGEGPTAAAACPPSKPCSQAVPGAAQAAGEGASARSSCSRSAREGPAAGRRAGVPQLFFSARSPRKRFSSVTSVGHASSDWALRLHGWVGGGAGSEAVRAHVGERSPRNLSGSFQ